jgi:hypothetical protein
LGPYRQKKHLARAVLVVGAPLNRVLILQGVVTS